MANHDVNSTQHIEKKAEIMALFSALVTALKREIHGYEHLDRFFLRERDILVKYSLEELGASNAQKERFLAETAMAGHDRMELVREIRTVLNIDKSEVGLSELISCADDCQKKELETCQATLRSLLLKIHGLNENNRILLDACLLHVRKSIDFICEVAAPCPTYVAGGTIKTQQTQGHIVSRRG